MDLANTLRVLGEETRLRMVRLLSRQSLNVGELTQVLGLAQPTVSKHLAALKKAGLVEDTRSGGYSYYGLTEGVRGRWEAVISSLSDSQDQKGDLARLREVLEQRQERAEGPDRFVVPGRSWVAWGRSLGLLLPGWRVADLGCGDGTFALEMASWAKLVYALDCNRQLLRMARHKAQGIRNIRFLQERMEKISLRAHSVDLVVISQSLHYLEEPRQGLQEAYRILAPGGRILVLDLLPHREAWVTSELHHRWLGFDLRSVKKWLRETGFRSLLTQRVPRHGVEPFRVFIAAGTKP